jgi:hypothetical protein
VRTGSPRAGWFRCSFSSERVADVQIELSYAWRSAVAQRTSVVATWPPSVGHFSSAAPLQMPSASAALPNQQRATAQSSRSSSSSNSTAVAAARHLTTPAERLPAKPRRPAEAAVIAADGSAGEHSASLPAGLALPPVQGALLRLLLPRSLTHVCMYVDVKSRPYPQGHCSRAT